MKITTRFIALSAQVLKDTTSGFVSLINLVDVYEKEKDGVEDTGPFSITASFLIEDAKKGEDVASISFSLVKPNGEISAKPRIFDINFRESTDIQVSGCILNITHLNVDIEGVYKIVVHYEDIEIGSTTFYVSPYEDVK